MPVATESTQEYRELRELLDTGSAGGAATLEEAERKQALMVFGGAAAVVLLVIVGLVALPKDDDKDGGKAAAEDTEATTGEGAATTEETATATTLAPVATPEGLSAFQYEVPSANVLPGLKPGDRVDFFLSADLVAANILVKGIGGESEPLPGFPIRQLTLAASPEDMRKLNAALPKTKRSMATAAAPAPAPDPAAPPATDPAAPPG